MSGRPTDDTIALVGFLLGGGYLSADEIRHGVARLGFRLPSSQFAAARLTSMTKEDCPRFEKRDRFGYRDYRVTHWASTGLNNAWRGIWAFQLGDLLTNRTDPNPRQEAG